MTGSAVARNLAQWAGRRRLGRRVRLWLVLPLGLLPVLAAEAHIFTAFRVPSSGEEALIKINWTAETNAFERWRYERSLGLTFPARQDSGWSTYHMPDPSRAVIEALVSHPGIAETADIDRTTLTPRHIVHDYAESVLPPGLERFRKVVWLWLGLCGLVAAGVVGAAASAVRARLRREPTPGARRRHLTWLPVAVWLLATIVLETHVAMAYYTLWPDEGLVKVRWADGIGALERWKLERRLALTFPEHEDGSWWAYHVPDPSSKALEMLVLDSHVVDTRQIDRQLFKADVIVRDYAGSMLPARIWWWRAALCIVPLAVTMISRRAGVTLLEAIAAVRAVIALLLVMPAHRTRVRVDAHVGRAIQAGVLFALALLPLSAWSMVKDRQSPELRAATIYQRGIPPVGAGEFLSQDPDILDNEVYFHDFYDAIEQARRADVIFTGNSRAVYAFRHEAVKPLFDRVGLRYYNLAFAGGADAFPLALMRKYDIRPKILVVNVHDFFANHLTRFGVRAMAKDRFTAWNNVFERHASWRIRYELHRVLPHWPTQLAHSRDVQVVYRRSSDGTWKWVLPVDVNKAMGNYPPPRNPDDPVENAEIERLTSLQLEHGRPFLDEMEARGTKVILVFVPWSDTVAYYAAENVAKALGRPLLVAWPDGLHAAIGSHIGETGAIRYLEALMPQLLATPEFQAILPTHGQARR